MLNNCLAFLDSQSSVPGRKQRVQLKELDWKQSLLSLHTPTLSFTAEGKGKFYHVIRWKFWPLLKGSMMSTLKDIWMARRGAEGEQMRANVMKSGVARARGGWEVAIDLWIAVLDGCALEKKSKLGNAKYMRSPFSNRPIEVSSDDENEENPIDRTLPAFNKRAMTGQLRSMMRDGDRNMIAPLKDMEKQQIGRWEGIFSEIIERR